MSRYTSCTVKVYAKCVRPEFWGCPEKLAADPGTVPQRWAGTRPAPTVAFGEMVKTAREGVRADTGLGTAGVAAGCLATRGG